MSGAMTEPASEEPDPLARAWAATDAALPVGWSLDSLRCASTGLAPAARSTEWLAVAIGPGGQQRIGQGSDALAALDALAQLFR